jgi:capsular exopolysaccharide synthesis family protein
MAKRLTASDVAPELRVLREAYTSVFPSRADAPLFLGIGAGVGLALVAALFLVPALRRPSFAGVEQLAEQTGLPVIAAIPLLARERGAGDAAGGDVVVASNPHCIAAEQYRRFLPHLPASSEGTLVLVTSAERGEGKSLTAANFAATAAADGGRRVLLIDADLRRPTQHRLLDLPREPGLCDAVLGDLALDRVVRATSVPWLFAMTAGQPCDTPLRLLESEGFARLLAEARLAFDVVLVDAPPLRPVVDAQLLARLAAMVILVVRADQTPRTAVLRALEELPVPVGLVLNGIGADSYRRSYRSEPYGVAYPVESEA